MPTSVISTQPVTSTLSPETIARLADVSILASLNETTLHCLDGATEVHDGNAPAPLDDLPTGPTTRADALSDNATHESCRTVRHRFRQAGGPFHR